MIAMTTIEIDTPDGRIDGLLSVPEGAGPWPGVVVIHDAVGYGPDNHAINEIIAGGLHEYIDVFQTKMNQIQAGQHKRS